MDQTRGPAWVGPMVASGRAWWEPKTVALTGMHRPARACLETWRLAAELWRAPVSGGTESCVLRPSRSGMRTQGAELRLGRAFLRSVICNSGPGPHRYIHIQNSGSGECGLTGGGAWGGWARESLEVQLGTCEWNFSRSSNWSLNRMIRIKREEGKELEINHQS